MKRNYRCWHMLLIMGVGLLLFWVTPICLISLSQKLQGAAPCGGGDSYSGWAFYGREHLVGPHALAGTWYNLPGAGPADGCDVDACVTASVSNKKHKHSFLKACGFCPADGCPTGPELGGSWFWMRSPEQERVAISSLYNRYCIRCHGVDGRGVWDIPGIPDFTNLRWQKSRSDDQIARIIIEGRGAVMPTFRGTLTLEESWSMARYLRTLVPGTEASRPDTGQKEKATPSPEPLPPAKGN